jgi:hypothetical protein
MRFNPAGNGGSREYERVPFAASVNGVADGIPQRGYLLPFVDEAGMVALERLMGG